MDLEEEEAIKCCPSNIYTDIAGQVGWLGQSKAVKKWSISRMKRRMEIKQSDQAYPLSFWLPNLPGRPHILRLRWVQPGARVCL